MSAHRCHLTVLFSDLSDSTHLAESIDPEHLAEIMRGVRESAEQVADTHHGIINQFYGDGILMVFGFPSPDEQDVLHAGEAARALHQAIRDLPLEHLLPKDFQLCLHSGIHSGLLFIEDGDYLQGRYRISGDALNTASRLADQASRDDILISQETLSGFDAFFNTEEIPPLMLKGKSKPVPAQRLLSRTKVNTRFEASIQKGLTPFIGRFEETELLENLLADISNSGPQVVHIKGNAGQGKTRLVEEILAIASEQGQKVFRAYCQGDGSGISLQPFVQLYSQLDESLNPLSSPEREAPDPQTMLGVVSQGLLETANQNCVVVFIDDWHWSDDSSRSALAQFLKLISDQQILLITASRPTDLLTTPDTETKPNVHQLDLKPFSLEDTARTIRNLLPNQIQIGLVEKIHERSGGNALFIEELCQSLSNWNQGQPEMGRISNVPATLHALIEGRIERLPEHTAKLTRAASVIGHVIPLWLFEAVLGYDVSDTMLEELANKDLIYKGNTEGTLRFKHGITRDIAYSTVPLKQRETLHKMAAKVLTNRQKDFPQEDYSAALAYHYAGAKAPKEAISYAEEAGNKAMSVLSLDSARLHYKSALDLLREQSITEASKKHWIALSLTYGQACIFSPSRDQIEVMAQSAEYAKELGDEDALANAEYWQGWLYYSMGEQLEAIKHYQVALDVCNESLDNEKLATQLLINLGQSYAAACQYDQALKLIDQASELKAKRKSTRSAPVGSAYGMACKATVIADQGQFQEAADCIEWAVKAIEKVNPAIVSSTLNLFGAILLWQGRWQEAHDTVVRSRKMAERVGGPYVYAMSHSVQAYADWKLVKSPASLTALRNATRWLMENEICLFISFNFGWLSDALVDAENYAEAFQYANHAIERAALSDRLGEAMAYRALARIAAQAKSNKQVFEDPKELSLKTADEYLDLADDSARLRNSSHEKACNNLCRAEIISREQPLDKSRELITDCIKEFKTLGMQWHSEQAERLLSTIDGELA